MHIQCVVNVYTVLFDSSIHAVLTDTIFIARTSCRDPSANSLFVLAYSTVVKVCGEQHNYIDINFCHMACKIKLIALIGATARVYKTAPLIMT